uniref:NHL repeat containing protein n=1 Tax=Adineta vaga TaxID=104782 RepID=B3G4F2_ADIVA|nr:NHL repeat containing protein [Adineta vaga]
MFLVSIFKVFIVVTVIHGIEIGTILNVSLIINSTNEIINKSSCHECLCILINSMGNNLVLSLNCIIENNNNNNKVICELFNSLSYDNSSYYQMKNNSNSIFYFRQLPSIKQWENTMTMMETTTEDINEFFFFLLLGVILHWNTTPIVLATRGNGTNQVQAPQSLFMINGSDILYIADTSNHRVLKWDVGATSGTIVAGGQGPGYNSTQLNRPTAVYIDKYENMFVADRQNFRVQVFVNKSIYGHKIYGNGTTTTPNNLHGGMFGLSGDFIGNIYIPDINYHRILKLSPNSTNATQVAGNGTAGNSIYQLNTPTGIYVDPYTGILYIANQNAHCIVKWIPGDISGTVIAGVCGSPGTNETLLYLPKGLIFDKYGNMYVADGNNVNNSRITMFCPESKIGIPIITTGLSSPQNVVIDSNFSLYIPDLNNNRVLKYNIL